MARARIRNKITEKEINTIQCDELKQIAILYFLKEHSELDIAFELGLSEKTIYRRIKEIRTRYVA